MGQLYEHDTVLQLLGPVVGLSKMATKMRHHNELSQEKHVFMRAKKLSGGKGDFS